MIYTPQVRNVRMEQWQREQKDFDVCKWAPAWPPASPVQSFACSLCRSYSMMPAATAAFRDSARPGIGRV